MNRDGTRKIAHMQFAAYFMLFALSGLAQTAPSALNKDGGQISGVVKDPQMAVVAGLTVTLTNQQTKASQTAVTDSQGAYTFSSVPPGAYVAEVNAAGFNMSVSPELNVAAGQTVNFDFALTLAGIANILLVVTTFHSNL